MTLSNNSLSNKLNEFKNKGEKSIETESTKTQFTNTLADLFTSFILLFIIPFKSFIFGYTLKLIFKTDWNIWGLLCIGLSVVFIFQYIENIFYKP